MELVSLFEQAQNPDPSVRRSAVRELARHDSEETIFVLVACLQDPSRAVVDATVHALIQIGTAPVAGAVIPLLTHEEVGQRSLALDVLIGLGRVAGPAMLELLMDENQERRKRAAEVLAESGYLEAGPALTCRIGDPDPEVRAAVAGALERLKYQEALPELVWQWEVEAVEWAKFVQTSVICSLASDQQLRALVRKCAAGPVREILEGALDKTPRGLENDVSGVFVG